VASDDGQVKATAAFPDGGDEGVAVGETGGVLLPPPPPPHETSGTTNSATVSAAPKRASEIKVEPPYCR
jgi:hypothetical protein